MDPGEFFANKFRVLHSDIFPNERTYAFSSPLYVVQLKYSLNSTQDVKALTQLNILNQSCLQ